MSGSIDKDALQALWKDGISSKEIAQRFGVTPRAVNNVAKSLGLPARPKGFAAGTKTYRSAGRDTIIAKATTLRSEGLPINEIGEQLGVSAASLAVETRQVMKADLDESGEDPAVVRAAYWRAR